MTDIELIATQAKQIEELKLVVKGYRQARKRCHGFAYNIGAPLNDNRLRFTPDQQKVIWDMVQALDDVED